SRCALPGSRSAPPTPTATGRNAVEAPQTRLYAPRWAPVAFPEQRVTRGPMRCHPQILFDAEEPFRVLGRGVFDLLDGEAVEVGELFSDVADVGGLVALAAVRDGCEVRGVGLHEDAVQGDRLGDVAQHRRVVESDDAGEREIKPQVQRVLCQPGVAREAVKDPADLAGLLLLENRDRVFLGIARVDNDRQLELARKTYLLAKARALHVARGVVVVVVQPDLAVGDDAFGFRQRPQFVIPAVLDVLHFVRVDAYGRGDEGVLVSQGHSGAARLKVAPDRHEMPDP